MTKIKIITNEISRRGGIEEVTRQVNYIFENSSDFSVEIVYYPQNRLSELWLKIKLLLQSNKNNVIMFMHPFLLHRFNNYWFKLNKSKIVCWAYGIDVWGDFGKVHTRNFVNSNLLIAISEFTRKQVLINYPHVNIATVNLGVDESLIKSVKDNNKNSFEILTVGRLSSEEKYKGHDLVIEALSALRNRGITDIKYHIVGSGNDLERLKMLVFHNKLDKNVIFHGYVNDTDIYNIYNRSSVFVMPSQIIRRDKSIWGGEGFGLVYLEAGLYGLPVIATNEGGQTDCIINGETGFLINGNVDELVEKLYFYYNNRTIAFEMGQNGRKYVVENFTLTHFKNRLLKVIQSIL